VDVAFAIFIDFAINRYSFSSILVFVQNLLWKLQKKRKFKR